MVGAWKPKSINLDFVFCILYFVFCILYHGGSVEAEVHQPLGNVDRLHTRGLLEVAHVDDELVGNLWLDLRKWVVCTILIPGHPFLCEGSCSGP